MAPFTPATVLPAAQAVIKAAYGLHAVAGKAGRPDFQAAAIEIQNRLVALAKTVPPDPVVAPLIAPDAPAAAPAGKA